MFLEVVVVVLSTGFFLCCLYQRKKAKNYDYWIKNGFPAAKTQLGFMEVLTGTKFNNEFELTFYDELRDNKFGVVFEGGEVCLLIKDLDLARNILVKDFDKFFDRRDFGLSDPIFAESLFFLQGQKWKNMRAFLSPTFTSGKIKRMFHHMNSTGRLMVEHVNSSAHPKDGTGRAVVVLGLMRRFAVEVIGTSVFGMETNVFKDPDAVFFKWAMKTLQFDLKRKLRLAFIQTFTKIAQYLELTFLDTDTHEFLRRTLAEGLKLRQNSSEPRDDFLQLLVEAMKDEADEDAAADKFLTALGNPKQKFKLSENMAIGQAFLFFFAGMDTVSMFLSFAAYELSLHPEVQERLFEEVSAVLSAKDKEELTYEEVNKLEYLDMVSSETLRLYPAVVRTERGCTEDYLIPGTDKVIPKGTVVGIATQGIHRDAKYYPNPENFDPDRFNAENKAKRNQYAYMPFGHGPRNCIGMRFAQIEAKTALAYLAYNFKIEPTLSTPIPVKYRVEIAGCKVPDDLTLRFISRK